MSDPKLNFVASYPKSGNTWVRMLVGTYLFNAEGKFTRTRTSDTNTTPFHNVSSVPVSQIDLDQQMQLRPAAMLQMSRPPKAILVKSHDAAVVYKGMALFAPQFTGRVVCVIRDPRDIAPSLAHHVGNSLERTVENMNQKGFRLVGDNNLAHFTSSWSVNVKSWLKYDQAPTHFVRYEDLHADAEGELAAILRFLGVEDVDARMVTQAVEKNRFDRVQRLEKKEGFVEKADSQDRFFRKGKVGSWREEVPEHLARQIEQDHAEMMREFGYELELADAPSDSARAQHDGDGDSIREEQEPEPTPENTEQTRSESSLNEVGVKVG